MIEGGSTRSPKDGQRILVMAQGAVKLPKPIFLS